MARRVLGAVIGVAVLTPLMVVGATTAASAASGSLTTTFAAGNSFAGNVFDVEVFPASGIEVTQLDVHLDPPGSGVEIGIWTRPGTSFGNETTSTGWTLQDTVTVTSLGLGTPTPVPTSFELEQGDHGMKIGVLNYPAASMQYTNGGPSTYSDAVMEITTNAGLGNPVSGGGGLFFPRIWNGTIHYGEVEVTPEATVNVTASSPTAVEGGAPGEFTFTRSGETGDSLTVGYSVSGSATAGEDYEPFGLVTFAAGQSSVTKQVVAVDDGVVEDDETVVVQLLGGSDYDIGAPISATVTITDPEPEPEPVDPCEGVDDLQFSDVDESNVHADNIACLAALGYAEGGPGGAPADVYGPRIETRRDQMASFVARIAEDLGVELPADPADAFDDDDDGNVHELRINQLAAVGIIGGNGEEGRSYRPADTITRGEMASYLNNLIAAVTGAPLSSDEDAFTDDDGSEYEADIDGLAEVGIVLGTGGGLYDPDGTVQRDSMASFLARTLQYLANAEVDTGDGASA